MTVGGMGFIPERLLMMMMMMKGCARLQLRSTVVNNLIYLRELCSNYVSSTVSIYVSRTVSIHVSSTVGVHVSSRGLDSTVSTYVRSGQQGYMVSV